MDKYPAWLWVPSDSPLHFLYVLREWYIQEYNDPMAQWTPESGMSWVPLFFWAELLFSLPIVLYSVYRLPGRVGTSGVTELLILLYAFETAFTTAVCINDVPYWDPKVYSAEQKTVFFYQLGPWVLIRVCPAPVRSNALADSL